MNRRTKGHQGLRSLKKVPYRTQPGNAALSSFSAQAERNGPSSYANQANNQQDYQANEAKASNAATNAGQTATSEANLAQSGGLSSGARERLQETGNKNALDMNQNVNNTTANNKMTNVTPPIPNSILFPFLFSVQCVIRNNQAAAPNLAYRKKSWQRIGILFKFNIP